MENLIIEFKPFAWRDHRGERLHFQTGWAVIASVIERQRFVCKSLPLGPDVPARHVHGASEPLSEGKGSLTLAALKAELRQRYDTPSDLDVWCHKAL